jgi:hypothetical protein
LANIGTNGAGTVLLTLDFSALEHHFAEVSDLQVSARVVPVVPLYAKGAWQMHPD